MCHHQEKTWVSLIHCWGCYGNKEVAVPNLALDSYLGAYLCLKPLLFSLSAPGIFPCQVFIPVVFLLPCFWNSFLSYYSFSQLKYHLLRAALLNSRDDVRPWWTIYLFDRTCLRGKLHLYLHCHITWWQTEAAKLFPKADAGLGKGTCSFAACAIHVYFQEIIVLLKPMLNLWMSTVFDGLPSDFNTDDMWGTFDPFRIKLNQWLLSNTYEQLCARCLEVKTNVYIIQSSYLKVCLCQLVIWLRWDKVHSKINHIPLPTKVGYLLWWHWAFHS